MKNNIDSNQIFNRKIILELRFTPIPKLLDLRGTLIGELKEQNLIKDFHWEVGDTALKISDSKEKLQERNRIFVEISRLSYVSTRIDTINSFFSKFEKIYEVVNGILKGLDVVRIGCRIQGTYKTKTENFKEVLRHFKDSFPSNIFLEDYPVNDLRFRINYKNGTYSIGPINENDPFLESEFPYSERKNNVGFAIDTDNFLLKTDADDLTKISKIKDVFTASLAVEKSLVERVSEF